MHQELDFDKLAILFSRATTLPPLPHGTLRLINEIDSDQSSAVRLERVIAADLPLAVEVIRIASGVNAGERAQITSLRQAILLLGQRSLRSLAVSLSVKSLARQAVQTRHFDAIRFVRHSLFVGIMAQYLQARAFDRREILDEDWTGEELLAAGVLHELGLCLLARVDPAGFDRVWTVAGVLKVDLSESFFKCYGGHLENLGARAAKAWGLPPLFVDAQKHISNPTSLPAQIRGLCCLHHANHLADLFGEGHCRDTGVLQENSVVKSLIRIPEEELSLAAQLISSEVTDLLGESVGIQVDRRAA